MKPLFNPSLMCMDFLDIKTQIATLNTRANMLHFDLMDGHFVKNITLSPDLAKTMAPLCAIPMDFHLMCTDPADYLSPLEEAVAPMNQKGIQSYFSPHAEVINGQGFRLIEAIRKAGFKVGIAVNPETPLSMIQSYMHKLDKITFMSVDPGFAGQPFIPEVLDKIREAKRIKESDPQKYHYIIEIDGSCNKNTFKTLADAGIESFIVGSSGLFKNDPDLAKAWDILTEQFDGAVNG
jgi:D-allulose-6-phosphate 3-epimerase